MSGCTRDDKPLISILMAVYHPRMDWLIEQLDSLNAQIYPNLELIICDDGPDASLDERVFSKHITAFPWKLTRNEQNLGSNKTFERLTAMANGDYIAYCDQDDIWLPEKLDIFYGRAKETGAALICGDVSLIDANGRCFAEGIASVRPRHIFSEGAGLAPTLIYRNFVIGCTTLIKTRIAQDAIPFAKYMVHDHYLAFFCALHGEIALCPGYMIQYRLHGGNQTGVLAYISTAEEYCANHLIPFCKRVSELHERFSMPELDRAAAWAQARKDNAQRKPKSMCRLWHLRSVNTTTTMFELFGLRFPPSLFRRVVRLIQAGKI